MDEFEIYKTLKDIATLSKTFILDKKGRIGYPT